MRVMSSRAIPSGIPTTVTMRAIPPVVFITAVAFVKISMPESACFYWLPTPVEVPL